MRLWFALSVLCFSVFIGPLAQAELVFEAEHLKLKSTADQEIVSATYKFTYTGERPIVVTDVDANCGCLNAMTDKERYEKGDKGTVSMDFEIGPREGAQMAEVSLSYKVDQAPPPREKGKIRLPGPAGKEPAPSVKRLTAEIAIPIVIAIEPKMTTWLLDAKPEPKEVLVTMKHATPITLKEVKSSRENVRVEVKEVKPGESYIITLTPKQTSVKEMGMLTLVTDCKIPRHEKKLAFYSIAAKADPKPSEGKAVIPAGQDR